MKFKFLAIIALLCFLSACEENSIEQKVDQPLIDSTAQVIEEPVVNTPMVIQIGAFRQTKNADLRASQLAGCTIIKEGKLQKVLVTIQTEDELNQIKQQFYGQDQPFKRLDK